MSPAQAARSLAPIVMIVVGLSGCGLKGPLYLPEKATNIEVRPAAPASAPATTTTPEGTPERDREKERDRTPAPPEE
jgi:predicted small lipoprotein YifL